MATHQQQEWLESSIAKANGAVVDVCSRAAEMHGEAIEAEQLDVMEAARALNDRMRELRNRSRDLIVAERGHAR